MCGIYIIVYSSLPPPAVVFGAKMNSDYFLSSSLMSFFFSLFRMWPVPHCSNILLQSQNSNGFCGPHHHVIWLLNVLWGYVKLWSSPLCWWQTIEPTAWNQNYLLIFVAVAETLLHSPYQTAVLGKSFVHFSPWLQLWLHSGSGRLWAVPAGSWFQVLGEKEMETGEDGVSLAWNWCAGISWGEMKCHLEGCGAGWQEDQHVATDAGILPPVAFGPLLLEVCGLYWLPFQWFPFCVTSACSSSSAFLL